MSSDRAWREYDIHTNDKVSDDSGESPNRDDPEQHAFDLFTQAQEPDEITYDLLDAESGKDISIRLRYFEDYTQSTGVSIWQASETLLPYLRQIKDMVKGRQVLELGAGVGLCSLAAHYLGASCVIATDGDMKVLEFLRQNLDQNRKQAGIIKCPQLIWGYDLQSFLDTHGPSDIVLAADVCYMSKSIPPLFQTAHHLLADDGLMILIHQAFTQEEDFHSTMLAVSEREHFSLSQRAEMPDVYFFRKQSSVVG